MKEDLDVVENAAGKWFLNLHRYGHPMCLGRVISQLREWDETFPHGEHPETLVHLRHLVCRVLVTESFHPGYQPPGREEIIDMGGETDIYEFYGSEDEARQGATRAVKEVERFESVIRRAIFIATSEN